LPFYTIAARVLYYGRYGSGAEDYRLPPLFVGHPQPVRINLFGFAVGQLDVARPLRRPRKGGCSSSA
jgi:hypothetical protein